jgi:IS5 family transposase
MFADADYTSNKYKRGSRQLCLRWRVQGKRKPGRNLSSIRARVEHVFRVIKRQFGFTKTR